MISKNKKLSMNALRKWSIVPVALVAMYLFGCNSSRNEAIEVVTYAEAEVKPMFNGQPADEAFSEYANSKTVYPAVAQENGISGRVFVEFIIDTDGSVTDVTILRGVDPLLDYEALRVINSSSKWTPGKHRGKAVKVKYVFPFNFMLSN